MDQDALLIDLCRNFLAETERSRRPDWVKVIFVGEIEVGVHVRLSGYYFNADGSSTPTSPSSETTQSLEDLQAAMTVTSPTGRGWVACLVRIGADGAVGADFEYDDRGRWAISYRTREQRLAEFAAMEP